MIRLGFVIFCLFTAYQLCAQQVPLIRFSEKHFWIQDGAKKIDLPGTIEYIYPFKDPTKTLFIQDGKKGLISNKGEILKPAVFSEIKPLEKGFYYFAGDSTYLENAVRNVRVSGQLIQNNDFWAVLKDRDSVFIFNLGTLVRVKSNSRQNLLNNFLLEEIQDTIKKTLLVTDSLGKTWETKNENENFGYYMFKLNNKTIATTNYYCREFSENTKIYRTESSPFIICATEKSNAVLIDLISGKVVQKATCDQLDLEEGFILQRKGNKWGVFDQNMNLVLPINFDQVHVTLNLVIGANRDQSGQVIRLTDRKKFPFPYDYAYPLGKFYKVLRGDQFGVVDTNTFKELLPPMFGIVSATDTVITGQNIGIQRRLGMDTSMNILYDLTVPKFREYRNLKSLNHDDRLDAQGWFYIEKELLDKEGFFVKTKRYYGLQNDTGKVIRKPFLSDPRFLFGRDFILFYAGTVNQNEYGVRQPVNYYNLAYAESGNTNSQEKILGIRLEDVYKKDYIRYRSDLHSGIITSEGSYVFFDFLDFHANDNPRVCISSNGKKTINRESVKSFMTRPTIPPRIPEIINEKNLEQGLAFTDSELPFEYENGKWNFLSNSGELLFEENFEFVNPFIHNRSIVQTKSGWGLIADTGFVIPPFYTSVIQFNSIYTENGDLTSEDEEVYLVQKTDRKPILRDLQFRELNVDFDKVLSSDEDLLLVEKNGISFLLNEELDVLDEKAKTTTFIGNGMYFQKDEKVYSIFDLNGIQQCETGDYRPYQMIFDSYVLCKKKGKYFVFNMQGDSVCQSKTKRFQLTAETAFITDGKKFHILLKDGTVITSKKNLELIADNEGKFYGTLETGKFKIYNTTGEKIQTLKTTETPYLVNGRVIYKEDQWKVLDLSNAKESTFDSEVSEVEVFDQFYHLITLKNKKQILYDKGWLEIPLKGRSRIQYWEEGVLHIQRQDQSSIYANYEMIELPSTWKLIEKSHFGKMVVKENNRTFYINQKGELLFGKTFEECTPFNGEAAAVKSYSGWTLIDEKGQYLNFPSFGKIINATENTFIELERTHYGLYDKNGNELLAPIYQKIELLDEDLISCLLEGHIVYFHLKDILKNRKGNSLNF